MDYDTYRQRHKRREKELSDVLWGRKFWRSTRFRGPFRRGPKWVYIVLPLLALMTALWARDWLGF